MKRKEGKGRKRMDGCQIDRPTVDDVWTGHTAFVVATHGVHCTM